MKPKNADRFREWSNKIRSSVFEASYNPEIKQWAIPSLALAMENQVASALAEAFAQGMEQGKREEREACANVMVRMPSEEVACYMHGDEAYWVGARAYREAILERDPGIPGNEGVLK